MIINKQLTDIDLKIGNSKIERIMNSKLIYIIGPYRSGTIRGVVENIRRAEDAAIRLWRLGAIPICPHMNSALLDGVMPDETFLAAGIEIMKRCDAVYLCEGWQASTGSIAELDANEKQVLSHYSLDEAIINWLKSQNG